MEMPQNPCWVVDLAVSSVVGQPDAAVVPREMFFESLWELLEGTGLCGLFEGALDANEAFAEGISDRSMVIDAAQADPDRDWVAARLVTEASLCFTDEAGARIAAGRLSPLIGCTVSGVRREAPRDWEADFRAGHGVIDVPGFGTVIAPWHPDQPPGTTGGSTLVIDPGSGFGTGLHATTRLCLAAIAAVYSPDSVAIETVLDHGSGSGILAIAAAVRGAATVDAVEIDLRVHDAICHNARLNGVADRIHPAATLDTHSPRHGYDLVVANIVAPVLLADAEALCGRLRRGGKLILSGLLATDLPEVSDRYSTLLGTEPTVTDSDGWHCLVYSPGA